jgi:hypothetical protein
MKATAVKTHAPKFWELLAQVPVQAGKAASEAKPASIQALAKHINQRRNTQ